MLMLPYVDTKNQNFIMFGFQFVMTMEILMTNKNNEMLVNDAYVYFKDQNPTDSSFSTQCVLSKCNGRVPTFQVNVIIINDHSHFHDPADFEKRKFRTAPKTRAVVADEPSRRTILSVRIDINREKAAIISIYSANQRTVNRANHEKKAQKAGTKTLN